MNIPTSFSKRLHDTFDGRLRIRWSFHNREYRIEQKVRRAQLPRGRVEEHEDQLICLCDGFEYLLSIRDGDRMPCPSCQWMELKVPVRDFQDIRCPYCASKGRQGRVIAGYWPLDDSLIQRLQMLDPDRQHQRAIVQAMDDRNDARNTSMERGLSTHVTGVGDHFYNNLVGIPQFGYSHAKGWPSDLGPKVAHA